MKPKNHETKPMEGLGLLSYVEIEDRPEVALIQGRRVIVLAVGDEAPGIFERADPEEVRALLAEVLAREASF